MMKRHHVSAEGGSRLQLLTGVVPQVEHDAFNKADGALTHKWSYFSKFNCKHSPCVSGIDVDTHEPTLLMFETTKSLTQLIADKLQPGGIVSVTEQRPSTLSGIANGTIVEGFRLCTSGTCTVAEGLATSKSWGAQVEARAMLM